ncbi:MAG TPA: ThiF family adenylyltransferase [Gemmatales bacterium]|nr:ThiF family adenylyltransferase [Gemmatales bacterium]
MTRIPGPFVRLTHLNIPLLQTKHVTIVGLGGGMAAFLALARQGVGRFTLIDFDQVEEHNIGRQDHDHADIGIPKVIAAKQKMARILPSVKVTTHERNICDFPERELAELATDSDLLYVAVDRHEPVALINTLCLRREKPFIVSGMYEGGAAGEIFFWHPGLLPCYHCVCEARYQQSEEPAPASDAASYSDVQKLDGAAVDLALGLLTYTDHNPLSAQVKVLGERNFLQMKFRHTYRWQDQDVIAECLGILPGNDAYVTFCTAARRDPDGGGRCPDCLQCRTLDAKGVPLLDPAWSYHIPRM